ncbi:MAG: cation:proton antiporter [Spirochaetales bacterium]|nr:cation:proton antiporter [Spirochaetales bacterium]
MKQKKLLLLLIFLSAVTVMLPAAENEVSISHRMEHLVLQLAVIILASRIAGYLFQRFLKQPRVLGELVSGMIIGPFALGGFSLFRMAPLFPRLGEDVLSVSPELYAFAVMASIMLLFTAGLETDLPTFIRFSGKGTLVGLGGVIVSFVFGDLIAVFLFPGVHTFMHPVALFLGTLSTATSVGITARILSEKKKMSSPEGVTILAAAVLDDVIGIIILAIVIGISKVASAGGHIHWGHIGIIALKAFGFWIICTVIGILLAPRLTRNLKRFRSMELIAIISLGLALVLAGLAEKAGLAMIIGAYVTGLSLSQTDIAPEIIKRLSGVHNFFVPIFFCVMGMMVDFAAIKPVFLFGLVYTLMAIMGKLIGCGIPALFTGFNLKGAFRIGAGMLPRGEVTLIVAGIGLSAGVIGSDVFGVAIMTMLIASLIAPPLLVKSFRGESGYKTALKKKDSGQACTIELDFPTVKITDFITDLVLNSFREAEYFVHHMDRSKPIYHLRKDNISITLVQNENKIILNTSPENEHFVRFLMLEGLLDLNELLSGLKSMKSPDMMGAELLIGMFGGTAPVPKEKIRKD